MSKSSAYAAAGVDTGIEAQAAAILYKHSKATWPNRRGKLGEPAALGDSFSGVRYASIAGLPEGTITWGNADGLGTKPELARQAGRYDTMASDLIAMVADDAAMQGAEPVHAMTVLVVNTLGTDTSRLPIIEELASGYAEAAAAAGIAIINGELAQHPSLGQLDKFRFDWDATLTWYGHRSRLIDGSAVQPGDAIVGLRESGVRCNGISLLRKTLIQAYGETWGTQLLDGRSLGDLAVAPSQIYSGALVDMTGGADLDRSPRATLHGAVHVTGGGLPEKLFYRQLARRGLGAVIDHAFDPSPLLLHLQELGNVSDHDAYGTWNMGQGMVLITPEPDEVIKVAADHGIEACVIGRVTDDPTLTIHSRGRGREIIKYGRPA